MDSKAPRILLVDDDKDLLDLLRYNLQKEGFQVKTVSKIRRAMEVAQKFRPELIVLDVLMPEGNGISLCREIRSLSLFKDTIIFFLSARAETTCRAEAFATGADDFIEKLHGLRAFTNKVNAVLKKRFIIKKRISTLSSDNLVIKEDSEVYVQDKKIVLTKPEFEILFFLMQNPDTIISKKDLIKVIWGSEVFAVTSSVQTYIQSLRDKIGPRFIEAVSEGRYRFNQGR